MTRRHWRARGARTLSLALVPFLVGTLLFSVIVPAVGMSRVTHLLSEIHQMVGPVEGISDRLEQVAIHERQSLYVNAALVIVALAAIAAVLSMSTRERRLAAALKRRIEEERAGAGLGLAISKRLAQALGGQILLTSKAGRGSTITFRIPVTLPVDGSTHVVPSGTIASLPVPAPAVTLSS